MEAPLKPKEKIHIKTYGCQMNVYDSRRMLNLLNIQGYEEEKDLRSADVVILNTCSIRDKSEHKVLSLLGELKKLKDKDPKKVFAVAGCVAQRMGRFLLQKAPHLDLVLGPDQIDQVPKLVQEVRAKGVRTVSIDWDPSKRVYSQPLVSLKSKPSEFLTIMKGCDHFCTYCIVPFVRGREKSRPIAEVVEDVRKHVSQGTREITFLGQNINTYGKGTPENLAQLILQTNEIEGLVRIRYITSHPRDLGDDLIEQFGRVEKLSPALHLPFQSGSNAILKKMSRLYTREDYLVKIEKLRKACPEIALSTDVIVGFPGETEEDFDQTLSLMSQVGFSHGFLFKYSPRPGTKAMGLGAEVPETVKEERLKRLQELSLRHIEKENGAMVGSIQEVLVEGLDKKALHYTGRTHSNKLVHVLNAGPSCDGKTISVEITEGNGSCLKGYYVDAPKISRQSQASV